MIRFCLYPHPTALNRGCEAIAVSTNEILEQVFPDSEKALLKGFLDDDERLISKFYELKCIPMPHIQRFSPTWFMHQIYKNANKNDIDYVIKALSKKFLLKYKKALNPFDIFLSIGGDNYCYGKPTAFFAVNKALKNLGKKTALWGCSIEPDSIDNDMVDDLKRYDLIIARESITYNALISHGLKNAKLYPDPAFTLKATDTHEVEIIKNTVGLNLSPMALEFSKNADCVMKAYLNLIDFILEKTDMDIALIPHVTIWTTNDLNTLKTIKGKYLDNDRVKLIGDHNCMEQKSIISKCRFFIGARTHATIAAYSSCVPTLVAGYSVKAKGIATDIFGTYENYVTPVQEFEDENILIERFEWLVRNEDKMRKHLAEFMPGYIEKAWQAGEEIKKISEI